MELWGWGSVSCCLSAAVFYLLSRSNDREAEVLKGVTRVNRLKDLAQLVNTAFKLSPLIVTVSGRVGADAPISCKCSDLQGVIVKETAEQHFLKYKKEQKQKQEQEQEREQGHEQGQEQKGGSWIHNYERILSTCKEIPWYLSDGTGRAYVIGACTATGFSLTSTSEVFEGSRQSLETTKLDYLQGLKMLGVKRTEEVLPTGKLLTVVGEAVKDNIGMVRIQKPHTGPFYVSHNTIDQLIANLETWSRLYKYASVGFIVVGVYLLAKHASQYVTERWRHRMMALAAAAKKQGQDNDGSNHRAENGSESSQRDQLMPELCVICFEQEYNSVFVPCGHMCCCTTCSSRLTKCPLCRKQIGQFVKTFRH